MQVQLLKSDVVQTIRRNIQLEKDLNTMDIKIGLLVKNQIALQEVVAHGHKLRKSISYDIKYKNTLNMFYYRQACQQGSGTTGKERGESSFHSTGHRITFFN